MANSLEIDRIRRRDFLKIAGVTAGGLVLASCGQKPTLEATSVATAAGKRIVYTELYGGMWAEHFTKNVFPKFTEKTGIEVVSVPGAGSKIARIDLMIKTGKVDLDLVATDASDVSKGKGLNLWEKIEVSRVPNLALCNPAFREKDDMSAPSSFYWMIMFLLTSKISETPDSWEAMWDPKYKGWVSILNDPGWSNILPITASTMGIKQEELANPDTLDKVWKKLDLLKDQIKRWYSGGADWQQAVAASEIWIGAAWNGRVYDSSKKGVPVKGVWPKEGGYLCVDHWVIPKGTPRKAEAEQLLDFLLTPEANKSFTEDTGFGGSYQGLADLITDEEARLGAYGPPGAIENAIKEDWSWYLPQAKEIEERWAEWIAA